MAEKWGSFVTTDALTESADAAMIASATEIPFCFKSPAWRAISSVRRMMFSFECWIWLTRRIADALSTRREYGYTQVPVMR